MKSSAEAPRVHHPRWPGSESHRVSAPLSSWAGSGRTRAIHRGGPLHRGLAWSQTLVPVLRGSHAPGGGLAC